MFRCVECAGIVARQFPFQTIEVDRVLSLIHISCTLEEMFADIAPAENLFAGNTTLGVVVTNGKFDKTPLTKLAGMAHNGYARAIRPVHTTADGDSIYALSLGDVPGDINVVGAMAALAMERAILRAVQSAGSAYGLIGWEDLPR